MSIKFDFIIVGAGIVGLATAYKLQLQFPESSIAILEKENEIGKHQTGRNSGVIHSGIYYTPGSYKAKNCKNGRLQLVNYAEVHGVPYDVCGKIIVATQDDELPILEEIFKKGLANKTEGIHILDSEGIKEKEPFIEGIKAIYVPSAGIIDYVELGKSFVQEMGIINPISSVYFNCEVERIFSTGELSVIKTNQGNFEAGKVIICAGLQSDRVAENNGLNLPLHIVGFRGDYYELKPESRHKIKNLVYPVPDPKFPFLGVHFTRMIHGGIECGPNAVFTFKREGYFRNSFSFRDTIDALTFKGTWKLFGKHWKKGLEEYRRAFSKKLFVKALQKMMPTINVDDVMATRSGVRAQAIDEYGNLIDDFSIMEHEKSIHVLNAPSPAATACLAIADEIVEVIKK
jgi:L-2-hydroxyglutarate oxidase